jgi:hypothetical protein
MPNPSIVPITQPRVPFLNPETGFVSIPWYRFLLSLSQLTSGSDVSLGDLQKGPPTLTIDEVNVIIDKAAGDITPSQDGLLAQIAELQKQVQAQDLYDCCNALISQVTELQKQVEALQIQPPPRQFQRSRYGSFYDTTTQTATTINTAKAITFNNTDLSNGVYLGTPTSRVYVDTPGIYNFDTSFQLDKTSGGLAEFYFWFRLNGTDVPDSASQIRIQGNDAEIFSSLNYFFDLNAGDYVEMMFSTSSLSVELLSVPATAPVPGIPSIILTVSNNIGGIQ